MARNKIALIGAGNIGGTLAYLAGLGNWAMSFYLTSSMVFPKAKHWIWQRAFPIEGFDSWLLGAKSYAAIRGADVVIVTVGVAETWQEPDNLSVSMLCDEIRWCRNKTYAPKALSLRTNPLDVMVGVFRACGLPHNKVVGMAGVLTRLASAISSRKDECPWKMLRLLCWGHGDTMVPLVRLDGWAAFRFPILSG